MNYLSTFLYNVLSFFLYNANLSLSIRLDVLAKCYLNNIMVFEKNLIEKKMPITFGTIFFIIVLY